MAIVHCPSCGSRMSDRWKECPLCQTPEGGRRRRRRFNPTPHYLISALLATIGTFVYAAQFVGHSVDPEVMRYALATIVVGAAWYTGARILAMLN